VALVTRDGDLPAGMDPVVAMDVVRRYVESERLRSRRLVVWTSTIFLCVVLVVLTLFISIGIYVVRNSRETTEVVSTVRQEASRAARKVEGVVDRVSGLENRSDEILGTVEQSETSRVLENRMFKTNLERFGKWVSANGDRRAKSIDTLESRLKRLESLLEIRQKQMEELDRKYAAALAGAAAPAIAVSEPAVPGVTEETSSEAGDAEGPETGEGAPMLAAAPKVADRLREIVDPEAAQRELDGTAQDDGGMNDIHVVRFPSGDRYEGQLRGGLLDGWGVYYFRNGDRYEGNFREDMKQGYGVLYFRNGDIYKGEFLDDQRHGKGTYVFANGSRYVGEFRSGKRHGRGRYIYEDGQEYIGEFRDGKADGPGFSVLPEEQSMGTTPRSGIGRS
jgi:hypothetical protein